MIRRVTIEARFAVRSQNVQTPFQNRDRALEHAIGLASSTGGAEVVELSGKWRLKETPVASFHRADGGFVFTGNTGAEGSPYYVFIDSDEMTRLGPDNLQKYLAPECSEPGL